MWCSWKSCVRSMRPLHMAHLLPILFNISSRIQRYWTVLEYLLRANVWLSRHLRHCTMLVGVALNSRPHLIHFFQITMTPGLLEKQSGQITCVGEFFLKIMPHSLHGPYFFPWFALHPTQRTCLVSWGENTTPQISQYFVILFTSLLGYSIFRPSLLSRFPWNSWPGMETFSTTAQRRDLGREE